MKLLRWVCATLLLFGLSESALAQWLVKPPSGFTGPRMVTSVVGDTTWTTSISDATEGQAWPQGVGLQSVLSSQGIDSQGGWTITGFSVKQAFLITHTEHFLCGGEEFV
jgi:hypothetical protein